MKPVYDCTGFIFYNLTRMFTLNTYYLTSEGEHFASYRVMEITLFTKWLFRIWFGNCQERSQRKS